MDVSVIRSASELFGLKRFLVIQNYPEILRISAGSARNLALLDRKEGNERAERETADVVKGCRYNAWAPGTHRHGPPSTQSPPGPAGTGTGLGSVFGDRGSFARLEEVAVFVTLARAYLL